MSYYSSTVTLNAEGDTSIQGDTVAGLGRLKDFPNVLFGVIFKIATPKPDSSAPAPTTPSARTADFSMEQEALEQQPRMNRVQEEASNPLEEELMYSLSEHKTEEEAVDYLLDATTEDEKTLLIQFLPDPGYFVAGGLAGVISRTATAPLDRLKVYLIANTETAKNSITAVKHGEAVKAAKHLGRPLINASAELWRAGGMRSLFAGKMCA